MKYYQEHLFRSHQLSRMGLVVELNSSSANPRFKTVIHRVVGGLGRKKGNMWKGWF